MLQSATEGVDFYLIIPPTHVSLPLRLNLIFVFINFADDCSVKCCSIVVEISLAVSQPIN